MRFVALASGSKANALLVEAGSTRLLVDCGLGPRNLATRLADAGVDARAISAVIVTHEHDDHVRGLAKAIAKWKWTVLATPGTLAAARIPLEQRTSAPYQTPQTVGDCTVELIPVPHDATQPAAVVVTETRTGEQLGVATDLGHVPTALTRAFARLDHLVIESNHCEEMLRNGPYPPFLQQRIACDTGHLSNRQTGELLNVVAHPGLKQVVLAHLSQKNNAPDVALTAARAALRGTRFRGALSYAAQDALTWPSAAGAQFELGF